MAKIPEFHFDFDVVEGKDLTEAVQLLFGQLEAHYNKHIKPAPILFGGKKITATLSGFSPKVDGTPVQVPAAAVPDMIDPDKIATPAAERPVGDIDTETVTAKTINMKSFSIKDGKELGLKAGDTVLKGVSEKGAPIFDKLLPGYDQVPYGPVVQGESGRYNLAWKAK